MKTIFRLYFTIKEITNKIMKDHVTAYAAQSSFFIIVCFFPMIILLFNILQYTPISEEFLLSALSTLTPSQMNPLIQSVINEIYARPSVTIISISAIGMLWVAGKAFLGIAQGLNSIYGIEENRNYFLRRLSASLYTLIFIVTIVISLLFLVFGNQILSVSRGHFPVFALLIDALLQRKELILQCFLTIFFMFLYKYVPNRKSSLIKELPGALFSAIGWQVFSFLYSLYINYTPSFTAMYGSLATIVFAMLWLYFCITIVFFGAELNTFLDKKIIKLPNFFTLRKKTNISS
ncbi:MAG: YihY/virulence factor BrkB family protein [Thermoflexaceae bacterium]|nr:YihY/virulence factor BrkB family protein [Thermoflexaceae bacterium]